MPIPRVEWASCPHQNIAEQARCLFQTGKMPIPRVEWASCPPQNIAEQARCLFHRIFSQIRCSLLPKNMYLTT
ncbi:MAG: hypothetical protein F6J90_06860 [Moorea sp. SIOASIH]|nr:hypothetical protein [Moorena sp. SIOASIH]